MMVKVSRNKDREPPDCSVFERSALKQRQTTVQFKFCPVFDKGLHRYRIFVQPCELRTRLAFTKYGAEQRTVSFGRVHQT